MIILRKIQGIISVKNTDRYNLELRRIFKECEKFGRSSFYYPDHKKYNGISRAIGKKVKPLITKGLMFPPASTNHKISIVALPLGVEIVEEKTTSGFKYKFKKKGGIW